MGHVRPSRVVYTRIGNQESWAGWTIAGFTPDVGAEVLNGCKMLQGRNSNAAKMMYDRVNSNLENKNTSTDESAKIVYEFFCEYNESVNSGFAFTKIEFGAMDESDSPGMHSTSILFPNTKNWEIIKTPQKILMIDKECFDDCELNLSQLDAARGRNEFAKESLHTIFESKEYEYTDDFSIVDAVSELFKNKKVYTDLIMCVYWNLTYKSSSSIFIETDNDLLWCIKLFLVIFCSVIYSYRTKLSFRTYDFEDANNQPTIVFCKKAPLGSRFFDIKTGTNNILTDATIRKLNKQAFVYYPNNFDTRNADNYFDMLDLKLTKFGNRNSRNIADLEAASMLVQDDLTDVSLQTNRDLLMRLITFCNLPISNLEIDMHIAMILETVMERKITVNEDIRKHIENKLGTTSCEELIEIGIKWHSQAILSNGSREKSFAILKAIREEDKNYVKTVNCILTEKNGSDFIDDFFAEIIGPEYVTCSQTILSFADETRQFGCFPKTKQFIAQKCVKLGRTICNQFYETNESLIDSMDSFRAILAETFDGEHEFINNIWENVKVGFWTRFKITMYSFDNISSYRYMACSDPRRYNSEVVKKCNFLLSISDTFKIAEKQNPNTVRALKNKLNESKISSSEKKHLIREFQKYCLSYCDKSKNFDFWFVLSELNDQRQCDFLFKNGISFFKNEDLYISSIEESEELNKIEKLDAFIDSLEEYWNYFELPIVSSILDISKDYERKLKKQAKEKSKEQNKKKIREHKSTVVDIWSKSADLQMEVPVETDTKNVRSNKIGNAFTAVKKRILGK